MNRVAEMNNISNEKSNFLSRDLLSSSFSHESNSLLYDKKRIKSASSYDDYELDSRQELVFNSIGTGSDNSYMQEINERKNDLEKNLKQSSGESKESSSRTVRNPGYAFVLNNMERDRHFSKVNDETIGGNRSNSYIPQADESLSTLSDKKKKIIVRVVTIFSIVFFLICFAMIAFTLRMSEKIDAQIRKGYMEYNFNSLSKSTKTINSKIISQSLPQKITQIIHKVKDFNPNSTLIEANTLTLKNLTKKVFTIRPGRSEND